MSELQAVLDKCCFLSDLFLFFSLLASSLYSRELHFPGSLIFQLLGPFNQSKVLLGPEKERSKVFLLPYTASLWCLWQPQQLHSPFCGLIPHQELWLLFLDIFSSCCPCIVTELVAPFINFWIMVPSPVWLLSNAVASILVTNSLH